MAEAPALVDLLSPLLQIAAVLVAIGIGVIIFYFVKALFGALEFLLSNIPFVGSLTAAAAHKAAQAITNAIGTAIQKMEAHVGHEWAHLAAYFHNLWEYQVGVAENLWHLVQRVNRLVTTGDITSLWHRIRSLIHGEVQHITRTIVHDVHTVVKVTQRVGSHLGVRVAHLEHAIAHTIPREIKTTRDLAREAENGVKRLWDRVRALEQSVSAAGIAALVAAALAAIGLDWLGCKDGESRVGRGGCNLWDDLGDVFGLLAAATLALEFEQFVHDAQAATEATVTAVKDVAGLD